MGAVVLANAFAVWEEAKNYGEPERFNGPERAVAIRQMYEDATGKQTIRPTEVPAGDD
jgi:hypothetical protein